jgi:hypothetical protein
MAYNTTDVSMLSTPPPRVNRTAEKRNEEVQNCYKFGGQGKSAIFTSKVQTHSCIDYACADKIKVGELRGDIGAIQ